MPSIHGIRIGLESQYDIKCIQEYVLPETETSLEGGQAHQSSCETSIDFDQENGVPAADIPSSVSQTSHNERSTSLHKPALIEVHVPIYTNSQFWLTYSIDPLLVPTISTAAPSTPPDTSPDDVKARYIFFKLLIPDHAPISFGVGAKDSWKGKTMFGLYRGASSGFGGGGAGVDKRGFWFPVSGEQESFFDVQIFRARGRRRASRRFEAVKGAEGGDGGSAGVQNVKMGTLRGFAPQRFYQYALLDAVDAPFVTFRYRMRSRASLESMGIRLGVLARDMEARIYTATEAEAKRSKKDHEERQRALSKLEGGGHGKSGDTGSDEDEESPRIRRLSFPPSVRLVPTSSFIEPHSPLKDDDGRAATTPPFIGDGDDSVLYTTPGITGAQATSFGRLSEEKARTRDRDARRPLKTQLQREEGSENALGFLFGTASKEGKSGKGSVGDEQMEKKMAKEKDDGKDDEKVEIAQPIRRKGAGGFLMGILESAWRRKGEEGAVVNHKREEGDGEDGDDEVGIVGRYAAVRESF